MVSCEPRNTICPLIFTIGGRDEEARVVTSASATMPAKHQAKAKCRSKSLADIQRRSGLFEQFCCPAYRMEVMTVVKRVIIFLLVAIGIFATVEFINFKIEADNHWGVRMDTVSSTDAAVKHTASAKGSKVQAHKGTKAPAISG